MGKPAWRLELYHAKRKVVARRQSDAGDVTDQWTMKDTIAHLTTWWRREVGRLAALQRRERPLDHPPQSQVPIINQWIYVVNRDRPAGDVVRDAEAAWQEFRAPSAARDSAAGGRAA